MDRRLTRRRVVDCVPRWVEVCEPRVLLAAGDPDSSFGSFGHTRFGPGAMNGPVITSSDPQGRILVAASFQLGERFSDAPYEGRLVRFTAAGQVDTRFGNDGVVVPFPAARLRMGSVVVDADGTIVWSYARTDRVTSNLVVQRYADNGTLLTTFETSGVTVDPNNPSSPKLFIQPDGKVVSGGVRFMSDGRRDPDFGTNGSIALGDFVLQAMQADGKLLATKRSFDDDGGRDVGVARFTVEGLLDTGFGVGGIVRVEGSPARADGGLRAQHLFLQSDGKILLVDTTASLNRRSQREVDILRLHSNGMVDDRFSRIREVQVTPFFSDIFHGLHIQPDGRILVTVTSAYSIPILSAFREIRRYNADGTFERTLAEFHTANYLNPLGNLLGQSGARVLVSDGSEYTAALMLLRYDLGDLDYRQLGTPFSRAYNPTADYHFFTSSQEEFRNAVRNGYRDEAAGNTGFALLNSAAPGATALFRLYNLQTGRHYYTANAAERDALVAINPPPTTGPDTRTIGWRYETIEGYIFTAAALRAVPIFRLYNQRTGTHLYTENAATKDAILSQNPGVWFEHEPLGFAYPTNGSGQVTAPAAAVAVSAGVLPASVVSATLPVGSDSSSSSLSSSVASLIAISGAKVEPVAAVAVTTELVVVDAEQWLGSVTEDPVDDLYARVGELADLLEEA
jgi:uncharacterized delta-60 repeat protein